MPTALACKLAIHPPVAPEQTEQVHQTLIEDWPDASLPPLQRPDLETAPRVRPVPCLRARGWRITYDNFRYRLVEAGQWVCDVHKREQQDWFSIGLGVEVDGRRVDIKADIIPAV